MIPETVKINANEAYINVRTGPNEYCTIPAARLPAPYEQNLSGS